MRHRNVLTVALVLTAVTALAQTPAQNARNRWDGYIGWGAGFFPNNSFRAGGNFGLGAEFLIKDGIGAGAELAMVASGGDAVGMASVNAVYQFVRSPFRYKGVVPFVTGGVTNGSAGDGTGTTGGNFGAGINWWLRERFGIRVETRDYIFGANANCIILRLGITFR